MSQQGLPADDDDGEDDDAPAEAEQTACFCEKICCFCCWVVSYAWEISGLHGDHMRASWGQGMNFHMMIGLFLITAGYFFWVFVGNVCCAVVDRLN